MKKLTAVLLALILLLGMTTTAFAAETAPEFTYDLIFSDENGMPVTNPRSLSKGDILNVELVLTRTDISSSYTIFGIEFRLLGIGLQYNDGGSTLRSGTVVRENTYSDGSYTGFAWYDMEQVGEEINNPVVVGQWSYTVTDPSIVNVRVPVTLLYVYPYTEEFIPTGSASVTLDYTGCTLVGEDISGEYTSGAVVILPEAVMGDWVFVGWTDGLNMFPAGSEYIVTGITTLTPVFEELERNRHLRFDPMGGAIIGDDPTGYYADGEIVIMPEVEREGFIFKGWDDGQNVYASGDEYIVYNTLILQAQWEETSVDSPSESILGDTTSDIKPDREPLFKFELPDGFMFIILKIFGVLIGLWLILFLLFLLLWKRRFVKYSLVNGDIALSFKDKDRSAQVEVILIDNDDVKHSLGKSDIVPQGEPLNFIKNVTMKPILLINKGKYKGLLIITDGSYMENRKCNIKVLDRELKDRSE